jgi:large subunit ribosomal protein L11|tara:strand:+ start:7145 stop:7804 length:660 start_codon:yes stop_codon:yes gene_type:complete
MKIKLLAEGGNLSAGPSLSQKLGPIGLNMNQVIQEINKTTNEFKGLKVPVELDINPSTKEFEVKVFSPPVSELLKKELGIEKGSGAQKKIQVANASIEQIISVTKTKLPDMLSKDLKAALKTVVGTCTALGILIENKSPSEIQEEIEQGKYDKEIQEEKTQTDEEKKQNLEEFFSEVKAKQDLIIKQEQMAKEAEAEKKEESTEEKKEEEDKKEEVKKK